MTIGFIGLGHQGSPMVERMIDAGHQPWLWARRGEVLDRYRGRQARLAASPAELGASCDLIGLCMYDDEATESVLWSDDGLMTSVRPGTTIAMHATVPPTYVRELGVRLAERGVHLVDAPVSGGDEAAASGRLLVITGGEADACQACKPMFDCYSDRVVHVGALGTAQLAKLINNGVMTAQLGLTFQAFELGSQFGIDVGALGDLMSAGSGASFSLDVVRMLGSTELASIRGYPTLRKDVALLADAAAGTTFADGTLIASATAAIADMKQKRAEYERTHVKRS